MSINRILCLVGSILYCFVPLVFFMTIFDQAAKNDTNGIVGSMFVTLLTTAICVFNWLAFAFMEKKNGKSWKIYLLVIGILIVIFGLIIIVGWIPGVLFILAFALKRREKVADVDSNNNDDWSSF